MDHEDPATSAAWDRFAALCERALFASRWALAPLYVGLVLALVLVLVKFAQKLVVVTLGLFAMSQGDLILAVLSLADLLLTANLLLMVALGGWENSVGPLKIGAAARPGWLKALDFTAMKLKLLGAISVIAAVYMLESLIKIDSEPIGTVLPQVAIFTALIGANLVIALAERAMDHGAHE